MYLQRSSAAPFGESAFHNQHSLFVSYFLSTSLQQPILSSWFIRGPKGGLPKELNPQLATKTMIEISSKSNLQMVVLLHF
jgi:hypothetical protein